MVPVDSNWRPGFDPLIEHDDPDRGSIRGFEVEGSIPSAISKRIFTNLTADGIQYPAPVSSIIGFSLEL